MVALITITTPMARSSTRRDYLKSFNAIDPRVYQSILAHSASQKRTTQSTSNNDVPGSAAYVSNNKDIAGAFTIEGWKTVDEAIHNVRKMFESEAWVLGDDAYAALDPDKIVPELIALGTIAILSATGGRISRIRTSSDSAIWAMRRRS